jgi:hypothetical protein
MVLRRSQVHHSQRQVEDLGAWYVPMSLPCLSLLTDQCLASYKMLPRLGLTRAIYSEGVENIAAGCNPTDLHQSSRRQCRSISLLLILSEIAQVVTISANGNTHVGNQVMEKVGKDGYYCQCRYVLFTKLVAS